MPPGVVTVAVAAAEAVPAPTTLRAAELKRTASAVAVAVEILRVRTVLLPPRRNPVQDRGDESAAQHPDATVQMRTR